MSQAKENAPAFVLRRGIQDHPGWRGVRHRGDSLSIPQGWAREAENVRFSDDVVNKPGLTKIITTQPSGEAFGLEEYGMDVARGTILVNHNYVAELWGYGLDWNPNAQDINTPEIVKPDATPDTQPRKSVCVFDDVIYFNGYSGGSYYLYQLSMPDKPDNIAIRRKYAPVAKFPADRVVNHMVAATLPDAQLWMGCWEGKVCRWDGSALYDATSTSPATSILHPVFICPFREKIYAVGHQEMKKYVKDNQWDTVTFNPPGISGFIPRAVASINDYLYAVGSASGGIAAAVRWNGTTWEDVSPADVDAYTSDIWGGVDLIDWNGVPVMAYNSKRDDPAQRAKLIDLDTQSNVATFGVGDEGIITAVVVSGGAIYVSINETYTPGTSVTRLLRLDNADTVAGYWAAEDDFSQWTLLKTWTDYGPQPAPELVDVLPA